MIASTKHRIAFLAMTKTGSTAVESALRPYCEVLLTGNPGLKHMPLRKFDRMIRPLLSQSGIEVETCCMFREPLDWLGSWYRYRRRESIPDPNKSTAGIGFEAFVEAYLSDDPPAFARIGQQSRFISTAEGVPGIDHLFRYERFDLFERFLSDRFGRDFIFRVENASPRIAMEVPERVRRRVRDALTEDYEIYEGLRG